MRRFDFVSEVEKILNDNDCKILGFDFNEEEICTISYTDDDVIAKELYIAYRFMNRARLRLKIMVELNLLVPVNPEIDLGF